ncbi:MAG: carboxypeptidase-like regulatory domain-containing protein [Ekhidna sp.]
MLLTSQKRKFFLVGILYLVFNHISFSQNLLEQPIDLPTGDYALFDVFEKLREDSVSVAFSPDKITNSTVRIKQGSTLKDILKQITDNQIASYSFQSGQLLISPYTKKSFTINGVLKNHETGEHVIGAAIQVSGTDLGTTTNGYGYYALTLTEGTHTLKFSHIGFTTIETEITLNKNIYHKISIPPFVTQLDEVEINSASQNVNVTSNIPSASIISISPEDGQIPYFLGEVDVIQNALLQPGIGAIGEDASGIHVRGGDVDQNLILLDEATIYNPNHFYGLISIFNPEAVNNVRIMKGFIPASYGGRSSSVIEVRQKEGNKNKLSYSGGIGLLSARGLIEGPLKKDKSSFLLSGRQSLLNLSIDDFGSSSVRRNRIRFQDLNLKINSRPNSSNTFYLSGYLGNDRNTTGFNSIRNWGNRMLNFRWNHLFSPRLFSNFSAFVSSYNYKVENSEEPGAFVGRSRITDFSLKADFTYSMSKTNDINFGFNSIFHRLSPGIREPFEPDATTNTLELSKEHGLESALYLGHESQLGKVNLNYGVRLSMLHNFGSSEVFTYQDDIAKHDSTIIDTLSFSKGELVEFYQVLEPRIALNWRVNTNTSLKLAYSKTAQYLHLISNAITPSPTDIWKLSDTYISPTITHHYSLGLYKNIVENKWEFNSEVYFKDIRNGIQYKNGADLIFNENIETELLLSRGRSFGLELYLRKRIGKLNGWVSYTLARAESRLDENDEQIFVLENHDKLHSFSTTWNMELSPRLSASSNFVFNSGIPVTLPTDKYVFAGNFIPHFEERNNSRLPNYHRLDLSVKLDGRKLKKNGSPRKNKGFWIFTVYNVYARQNAYSYFYRESASNPGQAEIVQYSIFGTIIPAVTYNFKF